MSDAIRLYSGFKNPQIAYEVGEGIKRGDIIAVSPLHGKLIVAKPDDKLLLGIAKRDLDVGEVIQITE